MRPTAATTWPSFWVPCRLPLAIGTSRSLNIHAFITIWHLLDALSTTLDLPLERSKVIILMVGFIWLIRGKRFVSGSFITWLSKVRHLNCKMFMHEHELYKYSYSNYLPDIHDSDVFAFQTRTQLLPHLLHPSSRNWLRGVQHNGFDADQHAQLVLSVSQSIKVLN